MIEKYDIKRDKIKKNDPNYKILNIDKASVFNCKIEKSEEMETSIFKEEYIKTYGCLEEMIKCKEELLEINNMIIIKGNKGSGKTTFINSITNSLREENIKSIPFNQYNYLNKVNFEVLKPINLECKSDKTPIISAAIFKIYDVLMQSYIDKELLLEIKDSFNELFKKVNNFLNNASDIFSINAPFIIKDSIEKIIEKCLSYYNKEYIIISFDNIKSLREIIDLKRYFNLRKFIILVTCDVDVCEENKISFKEIGYLNNYIYIKPLNFLNVGIVVDNNYFSNFKVKDGYNAFNQIQEVLRNKFNYYIKSYENFKIVIDNMCELINFFTFINSLKGEISEDKFIINEYIKNIVNSKLREEKYKEIIKNIFLCNIKELNKELLINLCILIKDKKTLGNIDSEIEKKVFYIVNNKFLIKNENVPLGHIITGIEILKGYKSSEEEKRFIEILKGAYTIRMLMEIEEENNELVTIVGKDYIGDYFKVTNNIEEFYKFVEINGRKSAEYLKSFFGLKKDLFMAVFEPCNNYNNIYENLLKKQRKNVFDIDTIYRQKHYILKFFNLLSYSIMQRYKATKEAFVPRTFLYVINIDYWMSILENLNNKIKVSSNMKEKFILDVFKYTREIILNEYDFGDDIKYDLENKGIEDDKGDKNFIVLKEDIRFIQDLANELEKAQYLYTYNV